VHLIRNPRACIGLALLLLILAGCMGSPSPLVPSLRGSVGVPHQGVLTDAAPLPKQGEGYLRLRNHGRHWGHPRLVAAIVHAARTVMQARPGAPLVVGDLSARSGGFAEGHRSHRTGRDVDLLFYSTSPDGRPVTTPGFVRFGPDGLGERSGKKKKKFVRLDTERQWLLVKALLHSPEADVQWLFVAHWVEALIVEHARARGEDPELVWHAETVLLQPGDSAAHDDHLHLRIACSAEEAVWGCTGGGPRWPWLSKLPELAPLPDTELMAEIAGDLFAAGPGVAAEAAP
jgi:penicillin-insensitive murein endopeptidase